MKRSLLQALQAARAAGSLTLIASLPRNDLALAQAAVAGGASVLKVHANLEHRASGLRLGSLAEEAPAIAAIRAAFPGLPFGIVLGDAPEIIERDLPLAAQLGLDFISGYAPALPAATLSGPLAAMIAFNDLTPPEFAAHLPPGSVLEASIIPHGGYGQPLSTLDLLAYRRLAALSPVPVVVPTQRLITPRDLPFLAAAGVAGLMFGAVVAGSTPEGFLAAARAFSAALKPDPAALRPDPTALQAGS